MLIMVFAA